MIRPFRYTKPLTLKEALDALRAEDSRPLAGGTDLLVEMRNGLRNPAVLVDIKGLEELDGLSVASGNGARIGARTPLNMLIDNAEVRKHLPVLSQAAATVATYQLRNRATLVGNICNGSPAADMAPALYILDAQLFITGPQGERKVPVAEFMTGVKRTALKDGELVLGVEIPKVPKGRMAFLKKQRVRGHDLAVINVAGLADRESGTLRICIGACAVTPVLLQGTDALFQENKDSEKLAEAVAQLGERSISPIDDVRSSKEYRQDMVRVFLKRLVRQICG